MKRIALLSAVVFLALLSFAAPDATARGGHHGGMGWQGPCMGFGMIRKLERLGLSETQKQQVAAILKTHRDEIAGNLNEGVKARTKLRDALQSRDYSEAAVQEAASAMAAHQEKMILLTARVMNELRSVLTPEQNEQLAMFGVGRGARMGGRMQGATDAVLSSLDRWIAEHGK